MIHFRQSQSLLRLLLCAACLTSRPVAAQELAPLLEGTYAELLAFATGADYYKHFDVAPEVYAVFKKYAAEVEEELEPKLDSFRSMETMQEFVHGVREHHRKHDKRFQDLFQEALPPDKADMLLGAFLVRHGAPALLHPVISQRLNLTESQQADIRKHIDEERKKRREGWSRIDEILRTGQPTYEPGRSRSLLDLRPVAWLRSSATLLESDQRTELAKLLTTVPPEMESIASFDW
jgi:hypothetical protein